MLRCLWKDGSDIRLSANADFNMGRNRETGILDLKCPRHHLDIRYDPESETATVRLSGGKKLKPFSINDQVAFDQRVLKPGDILHVLPGQYGYRFEIPDTVVDQETVRLKSKSVSVVVSKTVSVSSVVTTSKKSEPHWIHASDELLVWLDGTDIGSEKVAGFDLDGTLITTKSGRVFPKDINDWKLAFANISTKLKELRNDGYRVIIFTNQKGISTGKQSHQEFQSKIDGILETMGKHSISAVFVSPGSGFYRKPMTGMWDDMEKNYNAHIRVDRSESVYVGDAAGREHRKDHSSADRLFASNLGVRFMTPEEFFLDQPLEPFKLPAFAPKSVLENRSKIDLLNPPDARLRADPKKSELIVMVGYPGSGKSHFYNAHLKSSNYEYVNRDTLKTWQKCVQTTEAALKSGKSVVVDNTNPDRESRNRYIEVAKKYGAIARCFLMRCDYDQAMHNNKFRQLSGTDREHKDVNIMVINTYRSKFEPPSKDEGFDEIVNVNFVPKFDSEKMEQMYGMYLMEK